MIGAAAFGSLLLVRRSDDAKASSRTFRWLLTGLAVMIVVDVALIWLFGRVDLPAYSAHLQVANFIWPATLTAVFLGLLAVLLVLERRYGAAWTRRGFRGLTFGVVGLLLATQTAFLVVDDGPIPSSNTTEYASTPAVATFSDIVGSPWWDSATRETDWRHRPRLGAEQRTPLWDPRVRRIRSHRPFVLVHTWKTLNGTSPGMPGVYDFTPGILNATVARRYGISYVLEPHGATGPTGGVFVTRVDDEDLYRIPGAAAATLVPAATLAIGRRSGCSRKGRNHRAGPVPPDASRH